MKILTLLSVCCLVSCVSHACAQSPLSITEEKIQAIDAFLTEKSELGFSGSVLISEQDTVLFHQAYGLANRAQGVPNNPHTTFEIASITKLFTVVSILQLAEAGNLSLDDKISQYLGAFDPPKNEATIKQLLLHTAGLVPRGYALDYDTKSGFLASVKAAPYESLPGEAYRYTNAGYILLAAIIEEVSHMTYEEYLISHIFKPLNLSRTTFGHKDSMSNVANGYTGKSRDSLNLLQTPDYVWGDRGPSGIVTNVSDLQSFLEGLDQNKLLRNASLEQMYTEQMKGEAYGFHVLEKPGIGKVLARGGGLPHFESQIAWYKDQDIKVIILINNRLKLRQPVWDGIEQRLFSTP